MEEAEQLCDRVAIMDHGHILEMGTVDRARGAPLQGAHRALRSAMPELSDARLAAIKRRHAASRTTTTRRCSTRPDVPATIRALLELGESSSVTGLDLAVRRPTLEDVFLELTGRALRD